MGVRSGTRNKITLLINRVFTLQKSALRIMNKEPCDAHSSPLFHNTRILKVFDQIQCQNVLLLHKVINKKVPQSICESFTLMSHSHNTQINNPLIVPYSNTDSYGTYSIRNQCITAWNVYSEIFADKDLESLSNSVVKGLITTHFLNSYLA